MTDGPTAEEIKQAAHLLASLPDDWFDRSRLCAIKNAEEGSDRLAAKAGHKWRVKCRERFRALMTAVSEMPE